MESTQNKIYEIEESSALIDHNLKNIDEDLIMGGNEENKNCMLHPKC